MPGNLPGNERQQPIASWHPHHRTGGPASCAHSRRSARRFLCWRDAVSAAPERMICAVPRLDSRDCAEHGCSAGACRSRTGRGVAAELGREVLLEVAGPGEEGRAGGSPPPSRFRPARSATPCSQRPPTSTLPPAAQACPCLRHARTWRRNLPGRRAVLLSWMVG
jgi:hypothetical protein